MVRFFPVFHYHGQDPVQDLDFHQLLKTRFKKSDSAIFINGASALDWLLSDLNLQREDEVWIVTTFDFPNVSSCVTSTIFNHCRPSRVLSDSTKAILLIHEFGVPHPQLLKFAELARERSIPLIEDCAHTIDSNLAGTLVGTVGDWTLLSLPKVFPFFPGGALLGPEISYQPHEFDKPKRAEISENLSRFIEQIPSQSHLRRSVYQDLTRIAHKFGLDPLFNITENVSPWFFPIRTSNWREFLNEANRLDIDIARWHGTEIVVLPCHQCLGTDEFRQIENLFAQVIGS